MEPEWVRSALGGLLRAFHGCCAHEAPGRDGEVVVPPPEALRRGVGFAEAPPLTPAAAAAGLAARAPAAAARREADERSRGADRPEGPPLAAAAAAAGLAARAPAAAARREADERGRGGDCSEACPEAAGAAACFWAEEAAEAPALDECDVAGLQELMRQFVREVVLGRTVDIVMPGEATESGCLRLTEDLRFLQLETRGVVHEIPVKSMRDVRAGELPGPCSTPVRPDELCSTILMKNGECVTFRFEGQAERDMFTKCAKTLTISAHL